MQYLPALLVTVAVTVLLLALMGLGWRNRLRRQAGVAAPPEVPAGLGAPLAVADGQYICTTTAGDWLDRIATPQLGLRTGAVLEIVEQGAVLRRSGAPDLFIPAADLTGVRLESGMAGKFVEKDGLLVIGWTLGGQGVDTGFRPRHHADRSALAAALGGLLPASAATTNHPAHHTAAKKENQ